MLSSNLVLLLAFYGKPAKFTLPSQAILQVHAAEVDQGQEMSAEAASCSHFRLSENQIRIRFLTYHLLRPGEEHNFYAYSPCVIKGEIKSGSRTYQFETRPGHTLWTTYPDGKEKMLGGTPTDDPSGR